MEYTYSMNLKCTRKLKMSQNEIKGRIYRHLLKNYRKVAKLYDKQSQEVDQDQNTLA